MTPEDLDTWQMHCTRTPKITYVYIITGSRQTRKQASARASTEADRRAGKHTNKQTNKQTDKQTITEMGRPTNMRADAARNPPAQRAPNVRTTICNGARSALKSSHQKGETL